MVKGKLNEEKRLEIVYKMVFTKNIMYNKNNKALIATFYIIIGLQPIYLMYELLDLNN